MNTNKADLKIVIIAAIVMTPLSVLLNGFVLRFLWLKFVEPIFDIPAPSLMLTVGFGLFVSVMTQGRKPADTDTKTTADVLARMIAESFISPLFVLFLGWVYSLFV